MQTTSSTDTERTLAVELILEDIAGGGTVMKADFKATSTEMKEGALLGVDADGIYRLFKTAKLQALAAIDATTYRVKKNHEIKVGDYIGDSALTAGKAVTAIDTTNADYDVITLSATIGAALAVDTLLVQTNAAGTARLYTPVAIATNTVNLSVENSGCGLLVRGRVIESLLPYNVDATIKALLPLIRFA